MGPDGPRVIDFGVARAFDTGSTLTSQVVGTPAYMAPEQAAGRKQVLTTTDVYSLGVILYELLTGRRPFQGTEPLTILRRVLESEPEPPRSLNLRLDADLETVCLKCLRKEPERRYESALALAEDLERWLAGEPIQARRSRAWERGLKWVRRQPALAAALTGAGLAILGLIVLLGLLWRNAEERAAERADHDRQLHDVQDKLAHRQEELEGLEQTIDRRKEEAAQLQEDSRAAAREMRHALYIRDIQLARVALDNEQNDTLLMLLERQQPQAGEEDFRGFAWRYLWGRCHRAKQVLRGHSDYVSRTVFSPDGKTVLTMGTEGTLKIWEVETGKERPLPWKETDPTLALAFSPDGCTLALGGRDGRLRLRDWPSGRQRAVLEAHPKAIKSVAISHDGQTLATGGEEGQVKFWDRKSLKQKSVISAHREAVTRMVFSPDGHSLGTLSTDRTARLWDVASGRLSALYMDRAGAWAADVAFCPDGKEIAVVFMQPFSYRHQQLGSLMLADLGAGRAQTSRQISIPSGGAFAVAYAPDGQTLVWGSNSGNVVLWDRAAAQIRDMLHGHTERLHTLAFSADGRTLASGGNDKTLRLWDVPPRMELSFTKVLKQPCRAIAVAPDSQRFAAAAANGAVSLRSTVTGQEEALLGGQGGQVKTLAFAPDGRTLAVGNDDGRVHIWDVPARQKRIAFTGPRQWISSLAFSPDGRTLVAASREANVFLWDMTFGWRRKIAVADVWAVAFAPDGRTLALAGRKGVALCDPLTCQMRTTLPGSEAAMCVAYSPDGKRLAVGVWHRTDSLKLWDLFSGKGPISLQGHAGPVVAVRFTPDGRTVISASHDATVKFWDVAARLELLTLRNHHDSVGALELSADAQLLISSSEDGSIRLWRAPRQAASR
jgi:WD40 repeat protein